MERAVVVGRVIVIEAVLRHLVDEPAVDAFVEMGRFQPQEEEAQDGREEDGERSTRRRRGSSLQAEARAVAGNCPAR